MFKSLMVVLCVLMLSTAAMAEVWVGGQIGGNFTGDRNVNLMAPPIKGTFNNITTDAGVTTGIILGYNFRTNPAFPSWAKYFGVAVDYSFNTFNQPSQTGTGSILPASVTSVGFPQVKGYQNAVTFLVRAQYPFMVSSTYRYGRIVPFLMGGPGVTWTTANYSNWGGQTVTTGNFSAVAELGVDFYVTPEISVGPSVRYRYVAGPTAEFRRPQNFVNISSGDLNQFAVMARVAYHF